MPSRNHVGRSLVSPSGWVDQSSPPIAGRNSSDVSPVRPDLNRLFIRPQFIDTPVEVPCLLTDWENQDGKEDSGGDGEGLVNHAIRVSLLMG